jgi:acetate kinase
MQTLLERASTDARAELAIVSFAGAIRKAIGAYAASLGGLDLLVFTGGIGEHAARVRAEACRGLDCLGLTLDPERNERHEPLISASSSRIPVRIVPSREDDIIARHTWRVVG